MANVIRVSPAKVVVIRRKEWKRVYLPTPLRGLGRFLMTRQRGSST